MKLWVVSSGVCVTCFLCFLSLWASPHTSVDVEDPPSEVRTSFPAAISEKL